MILVFSFSQNILGNSIRGVNSQWWNSGLSVTECVFADFSCKAQLVPKASCFLGIACLPEIFISVCRLRPEHWNVKEFQGG
jgi:hypothetical protein